MKRKLSTLTLVPASRHRARMAMVVAVGALWCVASPAMAQQNALPPSVSPAATAVPASSYQNLSVAVIDLQAIARQSLAQQDIQRQISSLRQKYQNDMTRQQQELAAAEKLLRDKRTDMSEQDVRQRAKKIESDMAALQTSTTERKDALDKAFTKAMKVFESALIEQVGQYSREQGIDLILKRSQVFIADRSIDITQPVLERLNKALPTVKIDFKP